MKVRVRFSIISRTPRDLYLFSVSDLLRIKASRHRLLLPHLDALFYLTGVISGTRLKLKDLVGEFSRYILKLGRVLVSFRARLMGLRR